MKKTKIILLVVLALCLIFTATACSKDGDVYDVKNYKEEAPVVYSSSAQIQGLTDYAFNGSQANLALFSKTTDGILNQKIYNFAAKSFVKEFSNVLPGENVTAKSYQISLRSVELVGEDNEVPFFLVKETATPSGANPVITYTYYLYNAAGTEVAHVTKKNNVAFNAIVNTSYDIIRFNNSFYRINAAAEITVIREGSDLIAGIPDIDEQAGEYYYVVDANTLIVYDQNLDAIYCYTLPTALCENFIVGYLGEDNFFIQYMIKKFDTDKEFDVITNPGAGLTKYDLYQKVINVKKGKVSDLKLDYFIQMVVSIEQDPDSFNGLKSDIKAVAIALEIKDKMVANPIDAKYFAIGKDGKLGAQLNATIDNQTEMEIVANNRVVLTDKSGRKFLYDFKGKLIGEVTGATEFGAKYFYNDTAIYDYDLNRYDYIENGYMLIMFFGDNVLLYDDEHDTYKFYGNDNTIQVGTIGDNDIEVIGASSKHFVVRVTNALGTKYTVYNVNGVAVNGLQDTAYQIAFDDTYYTGATIAHATVSGHTEYFVIA